MFVSLLGTAIALGNDLTLATEANLQTLGQATREKGQVNGVSMPDG